MISFQPPNPHMECPRCSKRTIVRRGNDIYRCLNCNFRRDLSETDMSLPGFIITAILALLLTFLLSQF